MSMYCVSFLWAQAVYYIAVPCPKYFFKRPDLDQEKSAYGDQTVRYLQFHICIIHSDLSSKSYLNVITIKRGTQRSRVNILVAFLCMVSFNAMCHNRNGSCWFFSCFSELILCHSMVNCWTLEIVLLSFKLRPMLTFIITEHS